MAVRASAGVTAGALCAPAPGATVTMTASSACLDFISFFLLSSLYDQVDFNASPKRQRGHPDGRAGRKGRTKMLCVDAIHRDVVTQVREKHAGARNVSETPAGRLEHRREILEDALGLGHNPPRDDLASGRVLADLTAEVEEATDFDRLAKRANQIGRASCRERE